MSELEKLRDRRIGVGARCETCIHAYPIKATLKDTLLDCRQVPPPASAHYPQLDQNGNIVNVRQSTHAVLRPVQPNHFCSAWHGDIPALDS